MSTEAPPAPPKPATPPPQAGDDTSKSIFAQARIDAGLDQPPAPALEPTAEPAPEDRTTDDDTSGKTKSKVPDDVLDPSAAPAPKVSDAIAELESLVLPKNAKPEQIANFAKQKEIAKKHITAAETRIAELQAELEKKGQSTSELAAIQEKLTAAQARAAEIEEQFAKEHFEKSPKFRAQFVEQETTAIELAKSYLDGTEVKQDIIDLAAHATGKKRIELLTDAGVDPTVISAILPHLASYDTIQRNKQTALANWKATSQAEREQAQQEQQRAQVARTEQENRVWDTIVPKLDLLPFRESKDNPDWNARRELLLAEAKRRFNGDGADLPVFAETIAKGVAYDVQQEVLDHIRNENKSLREENARLKSAAPGGNITLGTQDGQPVDTSKMSREEVAKSTFNAEKAKVGAS